MAAGTSQTKLLETIDAVAVLQKRFADLVEVVEGLVTKVENLERQLSAAVPSDGR